MKTSSRFFFGALWVLLACGGCGDDAASPNLRPVAVAGPDQTVEVRTDAVLDGSHSFDPDGDPIFFEWVLVGTSDQAWLSRTDQALVRLTPRTAGVFMVRLTVDDGLLESEPDIVRVFAFDSQLPCQSDDDCDDDNPCTDDSCGSAQTCVFTPNQAPCDDGLFCTANDLCDGTGICTGTGSPCLDECQTTCNEQEQSCGVSPDGTPCGQGGCQDGDWVGQVCQAGACTGQDTIECDDHNECTEDSCSDSTGCLNQDLPDNTTCAGGQGICCAGTCAEGASCCRDADCGVTTDCAVHSCLAGQCQDTMIESGLPCDGGDGDLCNSTCDGSGGCVDQPVECDDGEYCNGAESCDPADGSCQPGGNLGGGGHCRGDEIVTCDGNGSTIETEFCALGCNDQVDPVRCYQVVPSNFDSDLLCVNDYDAVLSGEVIIDSENHSITGVPEEDLVVHIVDQDDPAPDLTVFSFNRLEIQDGCKVTVLGNRAVALASCGDVILDGLVNVSASEQTGGPGGFSGGAPGASGQGPAPGLVAASGSSACPQLCSAGGGGAGHGGIGGAGGAVDCNVYGLVQMAGGAGGTAWGDPDLTPLNGGSGGAGGTLVEGYPDTDPGPGGGGGGALQIVSGGHLAIGGGISAAGAGGAETLSGGGAGGGAGGAILLEAVTVELLDGAFLAANGGGGGGGDCT